MMDEDNLFHCLVIYGGILYEFNTYNEGQIEG